MAGCGCVCHHHHFNVEGNRRKQKLANKILYISIAINGVLSLAMAVAGFLEGSSALLSDAVHTFSDVLMTAAAVLGVKFSSKKADETHQYGHDKIESVVSCMLSLMLIGTTVGIGSRGIRSIITKEAVESPQTLSICVSFLCILLKEFLYKYMKNAAGKIKSNSIKLDACHQRIDAFSSVGVFAAIIGSKYFGVNYLDSIICILISLFTLRTAFLIYVTSIRDLIDTSIDKQTRKKIESLAMGICGIKNVENIKTRKSANKFYVEIEVALDGNTNVFSAHRVSQEIKDKIQSEIDSVKDCTVAFRPFTN